ncbi:MAG TPA: glycosyltransferase family 9 protein [Ignavibacteria bacterium]|nr:glycosyltransferase family 9 protein [Ignavibacteria bacterium]
MKVLVVQTAFIGDVILTLPMVQALKKAQPDTVIDFMCIPTTAELLTGNAYINEVIIYNKRKGGFRGLWQIAREVKAGDYDIIISPHRSYRSALIAFMSGCENTISFDKSDMSSLYKTTVPYIQDIHEIQRNLKLLEPLGIKEENIIRPELFPSGEDKSKIDALLEATNQTENGFICIAPGSVWFTKRYPKEKFLNLLKILGERNVSVFLIGGKNDMELGDYLYDNSGKEGLFNVIGKLSLLESTELIRRAKLLVTNDSAPLHIGNAMGTNVIAIYGATIPGFGFYPYGENDVAFETNGLPCRPCSIHGGNKCPIGTFECMLSIREEDIANRVANHSS